VRGDHPRRRPAPDDGRAHLADRYRQEGWEAPALLDNVDAPDFYLGPANIRRMVLTFLSLLSRLPGKDRLMAKAVEPIRRAANAIALRTY
jgi:hypothetical protein